MYMVLLCMDDALQRCLVTVAWSLQRQTTEGSVRMKLLGESSMCAVEWYRQVRHAPSISRGQNLTEHISTIFHQVPAMFRKVPSKSLTSESSRSQCEKGRGANNHSYLPSKLIDPICVHLWNHTTARWQKKHPEISQVSDTCMHLFNATHSRLENGATNSSPQSRLYLGK